MYPARMRNIGYLAAFLIIAQAAPAKVTDETTKYKVADGFKLEKVYDVQKGEGSWVSITKDGKGRFITSDQYGKLYRVTPPPLAGGETTVEPLDIPIGGAHGLLWNKGVLYVSVNERGKEIPTELGVWMVKEAGDGYGKPELIMPIKAGGEHGIHSLVLSPDGQWIYFVTGNGSSLPKLSDSFPAKVWDEDQLLPRNRDGRGHAANLMAPGGYVARFKLDGSNWQLVSIGQRNTYDIAFHDSGQLISYDSDLEWDLGMPWYRPDPDLPHRSRRRAWLAERHREMADLLRGQHGAVVRCRSGFSHRHGGRPRFQGSREIPAMSPGLGLDLRHDLRHSS